MLPASAFGFDETHFYSRMCYVDFDGSAAIEAFQNGAELNREFLKLTRRLLLAEFKHFVII